MSDHLFIVLATVVGAAVMGAGSGQAPEREPAPQSTVVAAAETDAVPPVVNQAGSIAAAVNAQRTARGLPALAPSQCATGYAQRWAAHLAATGQFAHQSLGPVMTACGATRTAENIASTSGTAGGAVGLWMASPAHRANILRAEFTHTGVGSARAANGQWISVQVFVTR